MQNYNTLSEAVNDLQNRGFTYDFNLIEQGLECRSLKEVFSADQLSVVEFYRFEGMSSTDDSSVVYAIETNSGIKGLLIDAYGTYSDSISPEMIELLRFKR